MTEMLFRVDEAAGERTLWVGSIEPFAILGRDLQSLVDDETEDRLIKNGDARREWFRRATECFVPSRALGPWSDILVRAASGQHTEGDAEFAQQAHRHIDRTRSLHSMPPSLWLDYSCVFAWENMTDEQPHHGGMRSTCRAFVLTSPTQDQIISWWAHVVQAAREVTAGSD